VKFPANVLFICPVDVIDGFTSSFRVGNDEAGFNLKFTSINERDGDTFRVFDCIGSITGIGVDVVFVVVDKFETTAGIVGT
jgi:hypothetical protein